LHVLGRPQNPLDRLIGIDGFKYSAVAVRAHRYLVSVFHDYLSIDCTNKGENCLLKENDILFLGPKVVITNEVFLCLFVIDS